MKFTHLHTHSHYSLLDGLAKIDDLINRCVELGMDSLALTDHGTMYGAIEFYQKAKKKGVKPIIGVEFYTAPNGMHNKMPKVDETRHHLLLLAKNETGYRNLIKLTTKAHLEGFYYKPRIDRALLKQHTAGLVATSACLAGEIPRKIIAKDFAQAEKIAIEYKNMFEPGSFFFELEAHHNLEHQDEINECLIKMGKKLDIPIIAANDIHYINKDDADAQDILLCIQTNRQVSDSGRLSMLDEDYSMKSPEQMAEFCKDFPGAIENTQKIVKMCNLELKFGENYLPKVEIGQYIERFQSEEKDSLNPDTCSPKKREIANPDDVLKEICLRNIDQKYPQEKDKERITKRLDFELDTIKKMGFASYFLIVEDYVNWAKKNGIFVGPGRGSAAGSIVSYLSNITSPDPLEYNLLFERFLNPDRISMPDIDIDFDDSRRDEVIQYVYEKYGASRVAQIITFGTMAARGSVRDAGRALGYPLAFCDKLAKMIPPMTDFKEAFETVEELKNLYKSDPAAKKLLDAAKRLEGVARHSSTHACGVVITPDDIDNHVPRQYASQNDRTIVTQYSMKHIESIGLLKMDFLGLANLTIIENALQIIRQEKNPNLKLEDIPLDNQSAYRLFHEGKTTGVFQFESDGMKKYLKMLKPNVFEDLISMAALYRPGPLNSGMVDEFIARKNGKKEITYRHPSMESALKNTYGVIVYQEQVMQLSKDMAGFSGSEADTLRRAMGKKIPAIMQEMSAKFIAGCEKNNIAKKIAQETFDDMAKFAEYGFNRSHAACYALIAYQTAYLKANYPADFMAALLASDKDNLDRVTIEIGECKQMGIDILPPGINESFVNFRTAEINGKEVIRFGLAAIKNVGNNIVKAIVEERARSGQYKSLADFLERIDSKDLNKKSIENLAKAGALDSLAERKEILDNIEVILEFVKEARKIKECGHRSLFSAISSNSAQSKINLEKTAPASKKDRLLWEKELLGFYLSEHPLDEFREYLETQTTTSNKFPALSEGAEIIAGGVIQKVQKIITKKGQPMVFAPIEDAHGRFEIIVFPKILAETESVWQNDAVIIVKGKYSRKDEESKILCDKAKIITTEEVNLFKQRLRKKSCGDSACASAEQNRDSLTISMPESPNQNSLLKKIMEILNSQEKGSCRIIIQIPNRGGAANKIATNFKVSDAIGLIENLKKNIGNDIIIS